MATAYTATAISKSNTTRLIEKGNYTIFSSFTMTGAFVINDTIKVCNVPAGFRLSSVKVDTPALDTGTSASISIGDSGSATRYVNAHTTSAQSGAVLVGPTATGSLGYLYTADDYISLKVTTAPQTGVTTGTLTFEVVGNVDNSYLPNSGTWANLA